MISFYRFSQNESFIRKKSRKTNDRSDCVIHMTTPDTDMTHSWERLGNGILWKSRGWDKTVSKLGNVITSWAMLGLIWKSWA